MEFCKRQPPRIFNSDACCSSKNRIAEPIKLNFFRYFHLKNSIWRCTRRPRGCVIFDFRPKIQYGVFLIFICSIFGGANCIAAPDASLLCLGDKSEKFSTTIIGLKNAFAKYYGFSPLVTNDFYNPGVVWVTFFNSKTNCKRASSGLCENFSFMVAPTGNKHEFVSVLLNTEFQGEQDEQLRGDKLCQRMKDIVNGMYKMPNNVSLQPGYTSSPLPQPQTAAPQTDAPKADHRIEQPPGSDKTVPSEPRPDAEHP